MSWEGTWSLEVATPFGRHPATLVVARDADGPLTAYIDSQIGRAHLVEIAESDERFSAVASLEIKGRTYEADVDARSNDHQLDGTINVRLPLAPPVKFTGTRL